MMYDDDTSTWSMMRHVQPTRLQLMGGVEKEGNELKIVDAEEKMEISSAPGQLTASTKGTSTASRAALLRQCRNGRVGVGAPTRRCRPRLIILLVLIIKYLF